MRLYPDIPRARAAAILDDVAVLVLLVLLAWLGLKVHDSVSALAGVPRGVEDAGTAIQRGLRHRRRRDDAGLRPQRGGCR